MKRLTLLFSMLAFVAAVGAVLWVATRDAPPTQEVPVPIARSGDLPAEQRTIETPRGGVYRGVVIDEAGQPVEGASVLLVAWDSGEQPVGAQGPVDVDPDIFDPSLLPVVDYRTAAEGRTDAGGRFSIAADSNSSIRLIAAYRVGYVPALETASAPGGETRIVLRPAGSFIGRVIDKATGDPVPGARITLYMQQRARAPDAAVGEFAGGAGASSTLSPFAAAQSWVARELGSRVWGIRWEGEPALKLWSDKDGLFRFGPIGDEVQLEFVIDHKDYMWTEFDRTEQGHAARTVVPPGQTVERTFELEKGKWISGRVVEQDSARGVPGVEIQVEHVSQLAQHWWYRTRKRRVLTGSDGSFRVNGLSFGPYTATMRHPSFGKQFIPSIPEFAEGLVWEVERRGAIEGNVEGLVRGVRTRITLVLEAVEENPEHGRQKMQKVVADGTGRFIADGIRPGSYRVWVRAKRRSSMPQVVEVRSIETSQVNFELGGGGRLVLRVYEVAGRAVDPAEVRLVRLEGEREVPLGIFVTREGRLDAGGVLPGRYRAEVAAPGYLLGRTEPFDVVEDKTTDVGSVDLRRQGFLRIQQIRTAQGQAPAGMVTVQVREGSEGKFRPLGLLTGQDIPVRPGSVTVKASTTEGLGFERTYEVPDGGVEVVDIVFDG